MGRLFFLISLFFLVSLFFNLLAYFSFNALLLISQCFLIKVKKAFKSIYKHSLKKSCANTRFRSA
ncbi:hypothetical protein EC553_04105 [Helicobacter pylori]|nr:hypothetical protein [Helicobacter pylori]NHB03718.1 hypothetical protein [Helicobacter pylori]RVZ44577.1 hypothetical protein EC553_04105 [Helicobacter pylori]